MCSLSLCLHQGQHLSGSVSQVVVTIHDHEGFQHAILMQPLPFELTTGILLPITEQIIASYIHTVRRIQKTSLTAPHETSYYRFRTIGSKNRGAMPLLNLSILHRIVIFVIENHFSLAKWPPYFQQLPPPVFRTRTLKFQVT